ncbi:MAG: N-acetyltransferase [Anaerolineaceae bacterium 4572_5.1]|nr:MAG: N-acetyltransferase [Anaerolineaceae bacterium 4572_5.1]
MSDYFKHHSSFVDDDTEVGKGTKIWHFSHIMPNTKIGQGCNIGQNVFVASNIVIGNNVKIQNNVSIYEGVILEDDVFLGPSMVFTNVVNPRAHIIRRDEYQITRVKKGVSIGANATIICGIILGEYAFVGAGAVVTHDIPSYALVYGNPAIIHGWVCKCGEKLSFQKTDDDEIAICIECGAKYSKSGKMVEFRAYSRSS